MRKERRNIGIGFATGRKSFQKILKTYVFNWRECGLTEEENVGLNLFVAYDLNFANTKKGDFTDINQELADLMDHISFMGDEAIQGEARDLIAEGVLSTKEACFLFSGGYAAKRNAVLYNAIKSGMDCLLFLDDDEYPLAVTHTHSVAVWGGQHVLTEHLKYIGRADLTNGYHCGYISPIPYLEFDSTLTEEDFRLFVEAISNDIVNWDTIRSIMRDGGVTYADTGVLVGGKAEEVPEISHAKFISGANLCINLSDPRRIYPFFNPPGAHGEDTFLSTCLSGRKVLRVPCYTFHDGFSTYNHIMDGVLPIRLKPIQADSERIINRFYRACIGWVRYKPLLMYSTDRPNYNARIRLMENALTATLPKISSYFAKKEFMNILKEFRYYHSYVEEHFGAFLAAQKAWAKIMDYLSSSGFAVMREAE